MKRGATCVALVWLCLWAHGAQAEGRINFRFDFNAATVNGGRSNGSFDWPGLEVEFDNQFATNKVVLSGVSIGVRRELFYAFSGFGGQKNVARWDEGTYLAARVYRRLDLTGRHTWSLIPGVTLLWGVPGTTLDRTVTNGFGAGSTYTHVFPVRNSTVPRFVADQADLAAHSALFYPEFSIALRRAVAHGGLTVDWIGGVRMIRFGIVDSGAVDPVLRERREFIPSIGLRVGFRIF